LWWTGFSKRQKPDNLKEMIMKRMNGMTVSAALMVALWAGAAGAKSTSPDVVCRVELDRGVLPAENVARAVVKVTLEAPPLPNRNERPPVNLCLVLDRSGSMSGDKMERAKAAAVEAVRRLGERDIVSLVIYDHEVETLVPAQSAANIEWIESRISSIHSRGNTALYGGLSQGAAEVRKNAGGRFVSRLILMSDGLANVGPSSPDDLGRLGASLLKEGISVSTVGLGTDYNEDLMTRVAQTSDGNTYFVENSADLPRIFAAELGDVLSVVARDVTVEIECGDGVRPLRIIGRDGVIRGSKVELRLNQLYGGQQKYALVEVEVPASAADAVRQIALARVDYDNALTTKRASSSSQVDVRFSAEQKKVEESVNVPVRAEVYFNYAAEARDQAVSKSDAGQPSEAAAVLRQRAGELKEFDDRYAAPAAAEESKSLEQEAQRLESMGGYDKAGRKASRASSWQIKSQQQTKE
jgi:Ca-activated chloride channel family protein